MTPSHLLKQVWPLILANASVPLLGFTDTYVIGLTQDAEALAALGLAVLLFNLLYWSFGFLRMSSTAQTAQAAGANNTLEISHIYCRAMIFAFGIALLLLLTSPLIKHVAFGLFSAEQSVEQLAQQYFNIRLWSAPATLGIYAASGILIGLGLSRSLLVLQAILAVLNAIFDILLVVVFDFGIRGIALGTVAAEYLTLMFILIWFFQKLKLTQAFKQRGIFTFDKFRRLGIANTNLLLRTWFLLAGFFWFINTSATLSTAHLAATHLLLQIITFSALVLDAFAYIAESRVGMAIGKSSRSDFDHDVRLTTKYSAITAVLLTFFWWFFGPMLLDQLTEDANVIAIAHTHIGFTCLYIGLSFAAFQLDGIYIGAHLTRPLRNNAILCFFIFLFLSLFAVHYFGYSGLWLSFVAYVCCRAISLYASRQQLYHLFSPLNGSNN